MNSATSDATTTLSTDPTELSRTRTPKRVAITGGAGFLGRNLIGVLDADPNVECVVSLDIRKVEAPSEKTRAYNLDLTSRSAEERLVEVLTLERVDTVVHLATLSSPSSDPAWAHELESVGTMHLVNSCRRTRVRKIVQKSQTFLYGAHPTNPNYLSENHGVKARMSEAFFRDKFQSEQQILAFGPPGSARVATVLRAAPIIGPHIEDYIAHYFRRRLVPTVMGFDPLWQFVHEADAVAALALAIQRDAPGIFNITGSGVLPLSAVIKVCGRTHLPLPATALAALLGAMWVTRAADSPPFLVDYLQYLCVADGARAQEVLGFVPAFSTREALIDFASAQHLRDANLLSETPA
ncbi:MAG: NAD-dependent epimerase/dehydratase family protein [Polyangiaceae bacterium]|nr:NAD-dependent epimerase/dehydratase family protein [Polyangiaceae bacterium]